MLESTRHRAPYWACILIFLLSVGTGRADDTDILSRGNGAEPESLDPAKSETVDASQIQEDLFEGLVTLDSNDKVRPGAAESWRISPDGLTYRFTLRKGLAWSNGDPLTAGDFVYSFRRVVDPRTASDYAYLYFPMLNAQQIIEGEIADPSRLGVSAPDDRTVEIRLDRPTGYFLSVLAHTKFMPVHRAEVEKYGISFTQPGHLVSNGAYMLQEWTPQSRIVLVKNPRFHDAADVHIGEVIYYPVDSPNQELNRYRAGDLDVTGGIPINQIGYIRQHLGGELRSAPDFSLSYYGFNLTKSPFAGNPKLRRALSMVIDREAIVAHMLKTGQPVAYGVVPVAGAPDYSPQKVSWAGQSMKERIRVAQQLFREAGYGPEHPLTIELRIVSNENAREVAIAVAGMWRETLGVETKIVNEEFKALLQDRHEKQVTQLFSGGWIGDYPDPTTFLDLFVSSSGENDVGYANPAYDALVSKAEGLADPVQRRALLQQSEQILLDDDAIIPLFDGVQLFLAKPYVQGFQPSACSYVYSKDVTLSRH